MFLEFIKANDIPRRRFYASSGDPESLEFCESFNFRGHPILEESGRLDLRELHNADRDSCDLKLIIRRFQQGDIDALKQRSDAFYGDLTMMPDNAIEAANRALAARQMFDALPLDKKREFDNDPSVWLSALANGERSALESIGVKFNENMPVEVPVVKGDVKPDVVEQ